MASCVGKVMRGAAPPRGCAEAEEPTRGHCRARATDVARGFAGFVGAFVLAACISVPAQHMSDARQALRAAAAAGGKAEAPELYAQARAHMAKAEAALRNHNYDRARLHARLAKANGLKARQKALEAEAP